VTEFLRFLADESCDHAVVRALRQESHDVLAISEFASQSSDDDVLAMALREERILLTEDKDFAQLVFARRLKSPGVILIRFPANARLSLPRAILQLVRNVGRELSRTFVVVQPGFFRINKRQ
jgi:predicted nuclease of predicted toxin-antitoxin system